MPIHTISIRDESAFFPFIKTGRNFVQEIRDYLQFPRLWNHSGLRKTGSLPFGAREKITAASGSKLIFS